MSDKPKVEALGSLDGADKATASSLAAMELVDEVRALIAERLNVAPEALVDVNASLDELCADSLDVAELVLALEEAFEVEISDEVVEQLRTVGDVLACVMSRRPAVAW